MNIDVMEEQDTIVDEGPIKQKEAKADRGESSPATIEACSFSEGDESRVEKQR